MVRNALEGAGKVLDLVNILVRGKQGPIFVGRRAVARIEGTVVNAEAQKKPRETRSTGWAFRELLLLEVGWSGYRLNELGGGIKHTYRGTIVRPSSLIRIKPLF